MTRDLLNEAAGRLLGALQVVIAACGLAFAAATMAQEGSTVAQEQLFKEQAISALTRKDVTTLFAVMDEYRALEPSGVQIPAGLFFAEADAARGNGDPVRAERAFNDFFRVASPEGATFAEAMRTYGDFRASIADTTWSILDTMVPVAGSTLPPAASTTGGASLPPAGPGLRIAPFSLGRREVTRGQFADFVSATGYSMQRQDGAGTSDCSSEAGETPAPAATPGADDPMACVSWLDAAAYVEWLSKSTGVKFRLPSASEWEHAARRAAAATVPAGHEQSVATQTSPTEAADIRKAAVSQWEWVADCAVTSGINVAPGDASPGDSSCRQRALISTSAAIDGATPQGSTREARVPGYRARNLGFRLAL
jgi:formylglycine-generating enzyme required for sulfatase activity